MYFALVRAILLGFFLGFAFGLGDLGEISFRSTGGPYLGQGAPGAKTVLIMVPSGLSFHGSRSHRTGSTTNGAESK